jgi:hypothetical protein
MNFDTYNEGKAACLTGDRKVDCAYIFYTTDTTKEVGKDLTAATIGVMCSTVHGVLRTKGIICESATETESKFTLTTRGGKRLGVSTPDFSAGVKVYAVALATSGRTQPQDILLVSTKLTQPVVVPAGTDIVITVTMDA